MLEYDQNNDAGTPFEEAVIQRGPPVDDTSSELALPKGFFPSLLRLAENVTPDTAVVELERLVEENRHLGIAKFLNTPNHWIEACRAKGVDTGIISDESLNEMMTRQLAFWLDERDVPPGECVVERFSSYLARKTDVPFLGAATRAIIHTPSLPIYLELLKVVLTHPQIGDARVGIDQGPLWLTVVEVLQERATEEPYATGIQSCISSMSAKKQGEFLDELAERFPDIHNLFPEIKRVAATIEDISELFLVLSGERRSREGVSIFATESLPELLVLHPEWLNEDAFLPAISAYLDRLGSENLFVATRCAAALAKVDYRLLEEGEAFAKRARLLFPEMKETRNAIHGLINTIALVKRGDIPGNLAAPVSAENDLQEAYGDTRPLKRFFTRVILGAVPPEDLHAYISKRDEEGFRVSVWSAIEGEMGITAVARKHSNDPVVMEYLDQSRSFIFHAFLRGLSREPISPEDVGPHVLRVAPQLDSRSISVLLQLFRNAASDWSLAAALSLFEAYRGSYDPELCSLWEKSILDYWAKSGDVLDDILRRSLSAFFQEISSDRYYNGPQRSSAKLLSIMGSEIHRIPELKTFLVPLEELFRQRGIGALLTVPGKARQITLNEMRSAVSGFSTTDLVHLGGRIQKEVGPRPRNLFCAVYCEEIIERLPTLSPYELGAASNSLNKLNAMSRDAIARFYAGIEDGVRACSLSLLFARGWTVKDIYSVTMMLAQSRMVTPPFTKFMCHFLETDSLPFRDGANLLLALTGYLDREQITPLWSRLIKEGRRQQRNHRLKRDDAFTLFLVGTAFGLPIPDFIRNAADQSANRRAERAPELNLSEKRVYQMLQQLQVECPSIVVKLQPLICGLRPDFVVEVGGELSVLEVDGPTFHFIGGREEWGPLNSDVVKDRLFEALGYRVRRITIPRSANFQEWNALPEKLRWWFLPRRTESSTE